MRAIRGCLPATISDGILFSNYFFFSRIWKLMIWCDESFSTVSVSCVCCDETFSTAKCISTSWVWICLRKMLQKILSPHEIRTTENVTVILAENHSPLKPLFFLFFSFAMENTMHKHRNGFQQHSIFPVNSFFGENGSQKLNSLQVHFLLFGVAMVTSFRKWFSTSYVPKSTFPTNGRKCFHLIKESHGKC